MIRQWRVAMGLAISRAMWRNETGSGKAGGRGLAGLARLKGLAGTDGPGGGEGLTRRRLLVAGGLGLGLAVGWTAWPREYPLNIPLGPGELLFNAYVRIAEDGRVIVAMPQAETGQGAWTGLAQIVADELGADWRTIAVEPAPIHPLFANQRFIADLAAEVGRAPAGLADDFARRAAIMVTAGSTSVRMFEVPMRLAAAAARAQLCAAAAARLGVEADQCDTRGGFVVAGDRRLRFGALAADAAGFEPPAEPVLRLTSDNRLAGRALPRLDSPAKLDGSANFAADVRLPGMVFAALRQPPLGGGRLIGVDLAAADAVPGVVAVVQTPGWVAAVATTGWAAIRAVDAMRPRFRIDGPLADDRAIGAALADALAEGGTALVRRGDPDTALAAGVTLSADYQVAPSLRAPVEPVAATAHFSGGRLSLWLATTAPEAARQAVAAALDLDPRAVIIHPMPVGGATGRGMEADAAIQAAKLSARLKRPVQLQWGRGEDLLHDPCRPAARARLVARVEGGRIAGWRAAVAVPDYGRAVAAPLLAGHGVAAALVAGGPDRFAIAGSDPPYQIGNVEIRHHAAPAPYPIGYLRGGAHGYGCFFTESFVDELARAAGMDPSTFRMAMLGQSPRLARCLATAATLAGWQGGAAGTGQGLACHSAFGSHVAVIAEARVEGRRVRIDRLSAVVDAGRIINPDIARQQVEGALLFGMAQALGASASFSGGRMTAQRLSDLGLPRLADTPEISIEILDSEEDPGGISELAVPPLRRRLQTPCSRRPDAAIGLFQSERKVHEAD
ncbi:xanthine dehydrogenase family protein molybdopterin-binding subunit [Sphingomonas changnyeongensis]|uniref:xanthine dehydrogenase family protein molybdopterin-binding subunit n=1 Tax=Sphingomonas changnyeongensis TaxID=2698679 RepID=UPI002E177619